MSSGNLLKEIGLVVRVDADYVYVQTQRTTGCSGCASESGCGTSALSKLFVRQNAETLQVRKTLECEVGDQVELVLDESRLLKHSFMAYGLPLIGLFFFAITASKIAENWFGLTKDMVELISIVGGALGLFAGWKYTQKFYKPVLPELGSVLKKHKA